jgi:predicted Zn finger-like uncharacterized protein
MKFLCGSCRTKYQISDEKVRGKILTIRCKKCGAKVLVKESLAQSNGIAVAPVAEAAEAREAKREPARKVAGSASSLAGAFEVAMGQAADDMPTSIGPTPANEENDFEWFTAIDGVQYGPFAYSEIQRRVRVGELQGRHYVWHDGFGPWRRVREVDALAGLMPDAEPAERAKKPQHPVPPAVPPTEDDRTEALAEDERPEAKIVDLSSERRRRTGPSSEPSPAAAADAGVTATAVETRPRPTEREEQLDSVLNEALGIEGEGATAQATPESTNAAAAALGGASSLAESFTVGDVDDIDPDSLFDSVPRATDNELVQRESTRFYVAAAGVNAKKSRTRMGLVVGLAAALGVIAFMGAWATGRIAISIPGVGNPFATARGERLAIQAHDVSEEEAERVRRELTAGQTPDRVVDNRPTAPVKPRTKDPTAAPGGYVSDRPGATPGTGTRGGEAEAVGIDGALAGGMDLEKPGVGPKLDEADVSDIPLVNTGRLDEATIRQVVNSRMSSVKSCYQRELKGSGSLSGKMEMQVTVEPNGTVSRSVVRTAKFKGTAIAACVADRILAWRFPAFDGDRAQEVVVPFLFAGGSN